MKILIIGRGGSRGLNAAIQFMIENMKELEAEGHEIMHLNSLDEAHKIKGQEFKMVGLNEIDNLPSRGVRHETLFLENHSDLIEPMIEPKNPPPYYAQQTGRKRKGGRSKF